MFAVSKRAVDACSNFLFAMLDMTATISVRQCPPVWDFDHEGWTRLVRYKEFFLITYVWRGWISGYLSFVSGEALARFESRHVGTHCIESRMVANSVSCRVLFVGESLGARQCRAG
eukprot:389989-Pelagomonas_calceolata.AAC.1